MFTRRIVRCIQRKSLTLNSFLAVSKCGSRNHLRVFLGQRQAKIPTAIGSNRRQAMIIDAFAFGSRVTYPKPCSKQHSQDSSRRGEFWQSFRYFLWHCSTRLVCFKGAPFVWGSRKHDLPAQPSRTAPPASHWSSRMYMNRWYPCAVHVSAEFPFTVASISVCRSHS